MLKPSLRLRLGKQLTMTPQLQQAIRLLQLPALELQAHIRELLETNVMLEADEETQATQNVEANPSPAETSLPERPPTENTVEILDEGWGERSGGWADPPA